jgi:hypothetical protein
LKIHTRGCCCKAGKLEILLGVFKIFCALLFTPFGQNCY